MTDYWKSHYADVGKQFSESALKQVGKTVNGEEISEQQFRLIVDGIVDVLKLCKHDDVIDLCCGNGLITRELAPFVRSITGIDYTLNLIEVAKKSTASSNVEYVHADVINTNDSYFSGLKKIVMYEALQHFSEAQFSQLLNRLNGLEAGSLIFLGSIPNSEKLRTYYNTDQKFEFHQKRELEGRPHIGTWWSFDGVQRIILGRGFKLKILPQKENLYTAYYRFDVLLERSK